MASVILQNLHWVVLFIGALIFFHELGHFVVAKAVGVKVLRFSLGFGPKLLAKTWGETEYAISALPLGGYVKMLGELPGVEIPPQDAPRAFTAKRLWQRSAIVLAGPFFNFVLAAVIYFAMGIGNQTFFDTRLGSVVVDDPAWQAGLRPGDKIISVGGTRTQDWDHLRDAISSRPGVPLSIVYERDGQRLRATVVPRPEEETNPFQEQETQGRIGISPEYVKAIAGVADPDSPAAKAGVKTGDVIQRVNGTAVSAWHDVRRAVGATPDGVPVRLELERDGKSIQVSMTPGPPLPGLSSDVFSAADTAHGYTGLVSKESLVASVEPDTPAASVGLQPGDRLLGFAVHEKDGKTKERPIGVWGMDLGAFQGADARSDFVLTYQHGRDIISRHLKLEVKKEKDDLKNVQTRYIFGAKNDAEDTMDVYTFQRDVGPLEAVQKAGHDVARDASFISIGIAKLIQGRIPFNTMGGPIMLFVIAGKSAEAGVDPFLRMLALISVNLGLLNLLPIPVLDGGNLLMFGIEAVRRRPPSMRVREVANFVGLALLLLLMVLVFRNDILRFVLG